ncbi:MAG: response regulator transcription factor [Clostridia bacterium]|nr:response regulator transcription factor [Clostridia bacterium]
MYRIYIAEDDPGIAEGISKTLLSWNFETRVTQDFRRLAEEVQQFSPHLILMDILLPYRSGYSFCSEIRKNSKVPIIFLSSAADNMNIVMAMEMGGDDFIAKPFSPEVLTAKISAMLRRAYDFTVTPPLPSCRGAALNTDACSLTYQNAQGEVDELPLTKNEYRILYTLLSAKGSVVSRERLMERLWETDTFIDDNTLTVNIGRLRKKLDAVGLADFIVTKVGIGYMIGEKENL